MKVLSFPRMTFVPCSLDKKEGRRTQHRFAKGSFQPYAILTFLISSSDQLPFSSS
jgi:hypothetical protein